jgi:hypothetical protein
MSDQVKDDAFIWAIALALRRSIVLSGTLGRTYAISVKIFLA